MKRTLINKFKKNIISDSTVMFYQSEKVKPENIYFEEKKKRNGTEAAVLKAEAGGCK